MPGAPSVRLEEVRAGSVRLALLDSGDDGRALPWAAVARTLAPGALVVSLSPFDCDLATRASLVVPSPAPLEALDEVLPATDDPAAAYAIAPALLPKPGGAVDTIALVQMIAAATGVSVSSDPLETRFAARAAALHAAGGGRFLARGDGEWTDTAPADPAAAWRVLAEGGLWIDGPAPAAKPPAVPPPSADALCRWAAPASAAPDGLALVAFAARGTAGSTPVSPLLTKLYQETELRPSTAVALVNPQTAVSLGLAPGQPVVVEGPAGGAAAALRVDASLPPGRVALAVGPERAALQPRAKAGPAGALAVAKPAADGTWREARVRVREA
jgi:hypothetical protein